MVGITSSRKDRRVSSFSSYPMAFQLQRIDELRPDRSRMDCLWCLFASGLPRIYGLVFLLAY